MSVKVGKKNLLFSWSYGSELSLQLVFDAASGRFWVCAVVMPSFSGKPGEMLHWSGCLWNCLHALFLCTYVCVDSMFRSPWIQSRPTTSPPLWHWDTWPTCVLTPLPQRWRTSSPKSLSKICWCRTGWVNLTTVAWSFVKHVNFLKLGMRDVRISVINLQIWPPTGAIVWASQ